MSVEADRIVNRLIDLAAQEREILLSGELELLPRLERTKALLLARLQASEAPADPAALLRLRNAASRNRQLYQAAMVGVRRARDLVAAMVNGQISEFRTYGSDGKRAELTKGSKRMEKRA